jgi:xylose isomerase
MRAKGVFMSMADLRGQATSHTFEEMVRQLKSFDLDLKFSAGIWYFSPAGGRFHERYCPDSSIEERLDIAANLGDYGLAAMEAHFPNEINDQNLGVWNQFIRDTGIRLLTVIPNIFYEAQWKWGSLSSPIPEIRRAAIDRTVRALELNKELDTDFAVVWPGADGYENSFGVDLTAARQRFANGLAEAMDAVPGVRIAEEPKPYEPRGHLLYGTSSEGILLGLKVESLLKNPINRALLAEGHVLCGMNPEIGHMLMAYEDLPYAFSLILEYGRLAHTHWNSQPLGNYDQDLNVGVLSTETIESALYVLKMHGYRGYFGIDINPERMPVQQALKNSMDAMRAANDRINHMDHERIMFATENPQSNEGWLEAYLIRQRAPNPERLLPASISSKP